MQFYHPPDEGNEPSHTTTGNTWHSLTPNRADSILLKGNGPCGTKRHMVAARIHIWGFFSYFQPKWSDAMEPKCIKVNASPEDEVKLRRSFKSSEVELIRKCNADTLNSAMKRYFTLKRGRGTVWDSTRWAFEMSCTELAHCSSPLHFPPFPQSKYLHPRGKKRRKAGHQIYRGKK